MKRVLITGKDSYIGSSFSEWASQWPEKYQVDAVGTRDGEWKDADFSAYDVIFHVAGIAHQDTKGDQKEIYFKVNRDLTIAVAEKAKAEGIRQFIFMSSMIVYGPSGKVGEAKIITKDTIPEPINYYGNSKLLAEEGILPLQSPSFKVAILRPPMIYGKGSKGNYPLMSKFAKASPIFPKLDNARSMLHIDNLTNFICLLIDNEEKGIFFPQNKEWVQTAEMVKLISEVNGKKVWLVSAFNPILRLLASNVNVVNKVFGNLVYDQELSAYPVDYCVTDLRESIAKTEA